mgnify:CR=1 FL=1
MWQQIVSSFSFQALWSPEFFPFLFLVAYFYFWAVGPGKKHFQDVEPVPVYKKIVFLSGLGLFYLSFGGPLYLIGHLMFSVHMIQMAVGLLIAPPLLLLGTPSWLLKGLILKIPFRKHVKWIGNPIFAVLLFNALFSFYHFPVIFDYLMVERILHNSYLVLLFASAMMMWWTIVAPVQEWNRLSELKRIGLIFLDGMLLTPACALIIFSNTALYATYTDPQTWAQVMSLCLPPGQTVSPEFIEQFMWLSLLEDQRLGGVLMKVIQEVIYGSFLGYVFFQWMGREKRKEEQLEWVPE